MPRILAVAFCVCTLLLVSGCGESERLVVVNEDGCVTTSGDEFILTDLHPGERSEELEHLLPNAPRPRPTTEAYLLVGNAQELKAFAGKRVHVAGVVDASHHAELRSMSPLVRAEPEPGAGEPAAGEVTPRVATQHQIRLEIHRLHVKSISPTGDTCEAFTTRSAR